MNLASKSCIFIALFLGFSLGILQAQTPDERPDSGFLIDTVYFQYDSYKLDEKYQAQLDSMIGIFTDYPAYYVEVFGHTDSVGSTAYNLLLSKERARQVVYYLVDQGVDLERIVYEGLGTFKPVASNRTFAGRRQNRRVDIAVVFSTETVDPVYKPRPAVTDASQTGPSRPVAAPIDTVLMADYETFFINPQIKTVIIAPQGTHIIVPAGTFDTDETEIEMTVGELYSRRDMIAASMTTLSRDGTLEAAGMFTFSALDGPRAAKITDGAAFQIQLPSTRRDANMSVYAGRANRVRRGRRNRAELPGGTPSMGQVREWREVEDPNVRYNGRDDRYIFEVAEPGAYAVARPLFYATVTDREDEGVDIEIKFKGRRFEQTTNAMIVGEVIKTYIPLRKVSTREYEARKVRFLDDETELIVIAYQFDDRGNAYWTKLSFEPEDFISRKKRRNPRNRPKIKLKLKFRKIDPEELNERLKELNV